jgi:3-deoxy-D-manno-octulosonic-acid transferase
MRAFYSALFNVLLPFILLRLYWRGIKAPDYHKRWRERFAYYDKPMPLGVIWFHAVSVGEAEALLPLVKHLQSGYPQEKILVTTTTPTGSARVRNVLGDTVEHVYLPYDTPDIVKRFMTTVKPKLAVVMETEIWPNLFHYCGLNDIPLFLINARLSEKSARGYRKLPGLIMPALTQIKTIAAQTQADADRYIEIGAEQDQVRVFGNIKFDLQIPDELIQQGRQLKTNSFNHRFVWIGASTHSGEEQLLVEVYQALKTDIPELLLILAPRHPERFSEVKALCERQSMSLVTRTSDQPCLPETDVYLADTMGELRMLYAAADVAFVGGSLVPVGGHNILEAIAANVPVLFGPCMANFQEIADKVIAHHAAVQCGSKHEIIQVIGKLFASPGYRNELVANGFEVLSNNRGALADYYSLISKAISENKR